MEKKEQAKTPQEDTQAVMNEESPEPTQNGTSGASEAKFSLGNLYITPGAEEVLTNNEVLTGTRTYTVHLRETRLFWSTVTVKAQSEDEAKELAEEQFEVDWSDSAEVESEVVILAVN